MRKPRYYSTDEWERLTREQRSECARAWAKYKRWKAEQAAVAARKGARKRKKRKREWEPGELEKAMNIARRRQERAAADASLAELPKVPFRRLGPVRPDDAPAVNAAQKYPHLIRWPED